MARGLRYQCVPLAHNGSLWLLLQLSVHTHWPSRQVAPSGLVDYSKSSIHNAAPLLSTYRNGTLRCDRDLVDVGRVNIEHAARLAIMPRLPQLPLN